MPWWLPIKINIIFSKAIFYHQFNTNDILTLIFIVILLNFFSSTQYHRSRAFFVSGGQKWTSHLVGWWWNLWWWLLNINSDHPVVSCRAWFYNFISFQDDCQKTWNLINPMFCPFLLYYDVYNILDSWQIITKYLGETSLKRQKNLAWPPSHTPTPLRVIKNFFL